MTEEDVFDAAADAVMTVFEQMPDGVDLGPFIGGVLVAAAHIAIDCEMGKLDFYDLVSIAVTAATIAAQDDDETRH